MGLLGGFWGAIGGRGLLGGYWGAIGGLLGGYWGLLWGHWGSIGEGGAPIEQVDYVPLC